MEKQKNQQEKEPLEQLPYTAEEIATAIAKIARAMDELSKSRLKRKAIVLLISHNCKLPQRDVEYVLDSLQSLEGLYLK